MFDILKICKSQFRSIQSRLNSKTIFVISLSNLTILLITCAMGCCQYKTSKSANRHIDFDIVTKCYIFYNIFRHILALPTYYVWGHQFESTSGPYLKDDLFYESFRCLEINKVQKERKKFSQCLRTACWRPLFYEM